MKRVFISRYLEEDKVRSYSEIHGIEIIPQNLIQFEAAEKQTLVEADLLFFYSAKGVEYFVKVYGQDSLKKYKLACLGPAAQKTLLEMGFSSTFTGNGELKLCKKAFNAFANNKHVLFARAANSRQSLETKDSRYSHTSVIVYSNTIRTNVSIPNADIYLFTSPLNVLAYLENGGNRYATAVAIGPTTYKSLEENSFKTIHQSETSSEKSIILKAIQLLQKTT